MAKYPPGWTIIEEAPGSLQAEILRGLLEAQGFDVMLSQEAAGRAIGLGVAPLATVHILVRDADFELARQLLDDYYAGKLES